jgi:hypothetical protein
MTSEKAKTASMGHEDALPKCAETSKRRTKVPMSDAGNGSFLHVPQ